MSPFAPNGRVIHWVPAIGCLVEQFTRRALGQPGAMTVLLLRGSSRLKVTGTVVPACGLFTPFPLPLAGDRQSKPYEVSTYVWNLASQPRSDHAGPCQNSVPPP